MTDANVILEINGEAYRGWDSVRITSGLRQAAASFELSFFDVSRASGVGPLKIAAGDPCVIRIDDTVLVDGYVDDFNQSYRPDDHTLSVTGRSKMADLIDCSAIAGSGQFRRKTLIDIALALASPFGVQVISTVDVGEKFRRFRIEQGETAFECIDRAAKLRGVLVVAEEGFLQFTRAGNERTDTVITPQIVTGAERRKSFRNRFSRYVFRGRTSADDKWNGKKAAQQSGSVTDETITRYRPLIVQARSQGGKKDLRLRAEWERNNRIGRTETVRYTLPTWTDGAGQPWRKNTLVQVNDPVLGVDGELLIEQVELNRSLQSGTSTVLTLVDKIAYEVEIE